MTLVRWRPMSDIFTLQNEIDRVFDSVVRGPSGRGQDGSWHPAVDLKENENEFVLSAELPGVSKEDVRISLTDNLLSLRGEKKTEQEESGENWHQVERSYGAFERHFQLGSPVDSTGIKATFKDGILRVTLPKSEEAKPREIKIDF